jgi:Ca2+/Na+ antiporter
MLTELGEQITHTEAEQWMRKIDPDADGSIHSSELLDAILNYVREKTINDAAGDTKVPAAGPPSPSEYDDDEDEEMEVPEDLQALSWMEQQAAIKKRAFSLMGLGTLLVVVFSDPMVDVMSNVGQRLSIPPFYISFVLAPLASNASELLASYSYARKKTQKTITVALAALEGAACMNNTFCLAIFMGLIYFRQLAWKFTSETLAILLIELIVGLVAMKRTMTVGTAYLVLALFPLSIVFIAVLEAYGFD